jgi:phospholipid/cholesterol/gamma-HCH transport system substrate-binding protein
MSKPRFEWKVGLFVFIGLALLGVLLLEFSKGLTFFRPTYRIYLHSENVGGLKTRATVLMAGVQVGSVADIRLAPSGTNVTIVLRIFSHYEIHKDARFDIQQSGFLGDNYVAIIPTRNEGDIFHDKEEAQAEPPFNLVEFVGSSKSVLDRVEATIQRLDAAITNVNSMLLNPRTLTNVTETVANLRVLSAHALVTVDDVNSLLASNSPVISVAVSNLAFLSVQLNDVAGGLTNLLATNAPGIDHVVKNVEASSEILKSVLQDVRAGRGTAGALLSDKQTAVNLAEISQNLSITSSNLNRLGLWGILWQHRPPRTNAPSRETLAAPKALDQ